jgi:hypothetical protein
MRSQITTTGTKALRMHRTRVSAAALVAVCAACVGVSAPALADAPVSLGTSGAVQRAGLTQDAKKNPTSASFGAPVTDDRRLFTLRWRLPWVAVGGGLGPSPFGTGFAPTGLALGGLSLASEPMEGLSSLIPQGQIGEEHKLGRLQFGALSFSMGHGSAVDRFTNSPDGISRRFGLLGEVNLAGLAAQAAVGDVFDPGSFVAARVAGRPLIWFFAPDATFQPNELDIDPRTEVLGIWKIAVGGATDVNAPGNDGAVGSATVATLENEAALLDNQLVKAIIYLDVNGLWTFDGANTVSGTGVHPGVKLMFDAAGIRVDVDAEANAGTDGYSPRYFDRLYALERSTALGANKPKLLLERPGSYGYTLRADAGIFEALTVFGELRDQRTYAGAGSNMTATTGLSAWFLMAGGAVTATQTGIGDNGFFGPGFVVTGEARVGLLFNTLHVVGRVWQAHIPAGDDPGEFIVDRGASAGLEVNFDML